MFKSRTLNINGFTLKGDEPITPRTDAFLTLKGMHATQADGFVILKGNFCLAKEETNAFLSDKDAFLASKGVKL